MMLNFRKRKVLKTLIIILAVILLLVILNLCIKSVKNLLYAISNPFQKFFWRIGNNSSDFLYAFLKIKDYSLIDCLIFMNKINERFQAERNRELPYWCPEMKEVHNCLYCEEKLAKDFKKYLDSNKKEFLI